MAQIFRVYVEKRIGFDVHAQSVHEAIIEFLEIKEAKRVRIFYRYDVEGIDEKVYQTAKKTVFSDPAQDYTYDENMPVLEGFRFFAVEYLPGQYDQRSDSAAQCIQLISRQDPPLVRSATLFAIEGRLSDDDFSAIKSHLINPVDSREARLEKPRTLKTHVPEVADVAVLSGFNTLSDTDLQVLCRDMGLAMSPADFKWIQDYFRNEEKREPSETELKMLDTYWSDHCRHTTFLTKIESVNIRKGVHQKHIQKAFESYNNARRFVYGDGERPDCLMDIATIAMKEMKKRGGLKELDVSEEINACSIKITVDKKSGPEDWLVMFKNETHNHPTEIEPFGGAATCLGGAIRDPLSGRVYVYQAMRVTGSGDPRRSPGETLPGKLPQRVITTQAASGYSSYGNQIGLATGVVSEIYDEGYVAKRMEIGAVIGAAPAKNVIRRQPQKGHVVLLIGGRTGRDGIGGATGSSKAHTEKALENEAEVQKGNPPVERKLQRLFRDAGVTQKIIRCNDFGAGGVSVAIGELADSIDINLDAVPLKYLGLNGTEIALSESQERMAVVIEPGDKEFFVKKAKAENLEATHVATITDSGRLRMFWRHKAIVDIDRSFLNTNGVRQTAKIDIDSDASPWPYPGREINEKNWLENLSDLNVASQRGLAEQFDSTIGAGTVLYPFGGSNMKTPTEAMVSLLPDVDEHSTATAMSWGFDVKLARWSPFFMAGYAVIESLAKLAAVGANTAKAYLTFQEYFERLGNDERRWAKPYSALLGAYQAQKEFEVAAIGGKDSMSGSFKDLDVPPTLVSFAVAPVDADKVISPEFKHAENFVYFIPAPPNEDGSPDYEAIRKNFSLLHEKIENGTVVSAQSLGRGGAAAAISKMCFGNHLGFKGHAQIEWFVPHYGGFIVETISELQDSRIPVILLGKTNADALIEIPGLNLSLSQCLDAWQSSLEKIFPDKHSQNETQESKLNASKNTKSVYVYSKKALKPNVFIPVFPGTNCEYDSAKAFKAAGAEVTSLVFNNMSKQDLDESITAIANAIDNSEIIMIPGGFSAGDEPEGSGKFIAAVFRNSIIAKATMDLLQKRDGLVLGICNGFQALVKLGLIPYGEISEIHENGPTLTFNKNNRHYSRIVNTKLVPGVKSPWFLEVSESEIYRTPLSNGEGRFSAKPETIEELFKNGQVATQYVDPSGNPSLNSDFNPSGADSAIEGVLSPDGRVFGKMGHSERAGWSNVLKNIPGNKKQDIFLSAVKFFSG